MTLLPTVRGQLTRAADHRARSAPTSAVRGRAARGLSLARAGTALAALSVAVVAGVAALAIVLLHRPVARPPSGRGGSVRGPRRSAGGSPRPSPGDRGTELPSLRPDGSCPTTPGHRVRNRSFAGMVLGNGPVQVLLADRGDLRRGRVDVGTTSSHGMHAIQTLWIARASFSGAFEIRGTRLGGSGRIDVRPGPGGLTPGTGPLLVTPGSATDHASDGDRIVPGSTWVHSPGCYAWEVQGEHVSEVIVFQALAPPFHGPR